MARREDEIKSQAKVVPSPVCHSSREENDTPGKWGGGGREKKEITRQMMERERDYEKMKHLPALR